MHLLVSRLSPFFLQDELFKELQFIRFDLFILGLPRDTDVFPMVCATSAKTKMELICAQRFRAGLAFDCARLLCKPQEAEQIYTEPYLEYTVPYLLYAKNNRFQVNNICLSHQKKTVSYTIFKLKNEHA